MALARTRHTRRLCSSLKRMKAMAVCANSIPEHAIILNIDAEHLDYYENLEAIGREFRQFISQTRGHVIFCADDGRLTELLSRHPRAISYGFNPLATYRVEMKSSVISDQSSVDSGQLSVVSGQSSVESGTTPVTTDHGPRTTDKLAPVTFDVSRFTLWHKAELLGEFSTHLLGEKNVSNAAAVIVFLHQLGCAPRDIACAIESFSRRGAATRGAFRG